MFINNLLIMKLFWVCLVTNVVVLSTCAVLTQSTVLTRLRKFLQRIVGYLCILALYAHYMDDSLEKTAWEEP